MRHRRVTMGKNSIKHSSTLLDNTGSGVGSFFGHLIYQANAGVRDVTGAIKVIKAQATTENIVNVGDIIKYVNVCLECSPRGVIPTNELDNAGWLEWALVWFNENSVTLNVTNIGVGTLGHLATNYYRGDCLMTGCFPVGTKQSMSVDLKFKLPRKAVRVNLGSQLLMLCYFRSSSSTDTRTDSHRLLASSHFKAYS